ncbi:LOW QUALITY PROTEIN: hypothetical protein U0070_024957, partial [Myodes glareolus]
SEKHEQVVIKLSVTTAGQVTRRRAPSPSGAQGVATWRCLAAGVSGQPGPPPRHKHCGARAEQAALDLARRAPRSAHGEAPGQLDSQAEQSRVSPSCPEWPARSQSRMPPQSELPSWAGNVCPPLVTSGCLDRTASYHLGQRRLFLDLGELKRQMRTSL